MRPWQTFKRLLAHCHPRLKVGLRRRKVQLHACSREGLDDCRRQQVNCASFLLSSKAFVSLVTSCSTGHFLGTIFRYLPPRFRYSNGSKKGPQSCMDTSSEILPSIVVFLVWRKLRSVRNALSNFTFWANIFISALKGAHAIQKSKTATEVMIRGRPFAARRVCLPSVKEDTAQIRLKFRSSLRAMGATRRPSDAKLWHWCGCT